MCGGLIAPIVALAASAFSGAAGSGDTQSYTPPEQELTISRPEPQLAEPTLGIDNTNTTTAAAKKGKNALVINRNPSVGIAGTSGSGVTVPRG